MSEFLIALVLGAVVSGIVLGGLMVHTMLPYCEVDQLQEVQEKAALCVEAGLSNDYCMYEVMHNVCGPL